MLLAVFGAFAFTLSTTQGANVYWVSFHPDDNTPSANALAAGFIQAPDAGYTQLLRNAGHTVTRVLSSGTPNISLLNAADLVIISRSVPSGDYQDDPETAAWNGITAPTMVLGGYVLRDSRLGYTTGGTIPDTTSPAITLAVTDPSHPIFDGIPVGTNGMMSTPFATSLSFDGILQRGISVNTDPVAGNGQILATVGNAGDPAFGGMVIGEWDAGVTLATGDALGGHRMVFLTGSREQTITSEGAGIFDLTADGSRLFLNAVNYMAVPEPSTMALFILGGASMMLFLRRRRA